MDGEWAIRQALVGEDLVPFQATFNRVLRADFPEYSQATVEHFIAADYSSEAIREGIAQGNHSLWLAEHRDSVIGFLLGRKPYAGIAFCNWVGVVHDWRERGVATALLRGWEADCAARGAHKIHLWTSANTLTFYAHQGYRLVGEIPDNFFGAHDYLFYKSVGTVAGEFRTGSGAD